MLHAHAVFVARVQFDGASYRAARQGPVSARRWAPPLTDVERFSTFLPGVSSQPDLFPADDLEALAHVIS